MEGERAMETGDRLRKIRHILAFVGFTFLALAGGFYLTKPFFPDVSNEILPRTPDKITSKIMTPYWKDFQLISARKHRVHLWYHKKRLF
jgi:hypothetical protein